METKTGLLGEAQFLFTMKFWGVTWGDEDEVGRP